MYSKIQTGTFWGVCAFLVTVEADISPGLPTFNMVGSLRNEVKEAKERVVSALKNVGYEIPPAHITVNLSPADIRKEGTAFDLPIAIAILEAQGVILKDSCKDILILGELGLNGEIKKGKGVLPIVREAYTQGLKECIVPKANEAEGAIVPGINVKGVRNLFEVIQYLKTPLSEREDMLPSVKTDVQTLFLRQKQTIMDDFSQVGGQEGAKRAAMIAAAGFHNLLMVGPPGAGKSMIAKRIPGIMPELSIEESLEVTAVASVAGLLKEGQALVTERPYQNPHHTISQAAFTGGGSIPRPGVISMAHKGVLFLDELPEFPRSVLDSLRQPMEERQIYVTRVNSNVVYPADTMIVAAMNPCPCGFYPDRNKCKCSENQIRHYMGKVSGPILDRMDLCVELRAISFNEMQGYKSGENSESIRIKVEKARLMQKKRFENMPYRFNADMPNNHVEKYCTLGEEEKECLEQLHTTMQFSARVYYRILKVARTIADLEGEEDIKERHLLEAAMYRPAQEYWM